MRWLRKFFKKEAEMPLLINVKAPNLKIEEKWLPVPAYIEADAEDWEIVSVIATAIAAGDHPESQFVVKKILQRNPEARTVAIIAASLAAEVAEDSQFIVKNISKKP